MSDYLPSQIGWEMTDLSTALTSFLSTLPTKPQLLALGEPTHHVAAFPTWRNRIFRRLVEHHGYRSIALESDVLAGLRVDDYANSGQETLDDVMLHGFSHGFGAVKANRDLVVWLGQFNTDRDEADRVRFYGFDVPTETMWAASPRPALLELHTFLTEQLPDLPIDASTITRLCGDDARWTNQAAAMDPSQSVGNSENAKRLRWLTDELLTLLATERPRLAVQADAFWHACLYARTALGLLRYHAVLADSSPNRVARMMNLRDLMMADTLFAIAEREASRGPTLVFAHNQHLRRYASQTWYPAGVHVSTRIGDRYAFVATAMGQGAGLPEPAPDTPEGWLSQQSSSPQLYATRALTRVLPAPLIKRMDTSGKTGSFPVFPLEPEHLGRTDGVFFIPTLTT